MKTIINNIISGKGLTGLRAYLQDLYQSIYCFITNDCMCMCAEEACCCCCDDCC